MKLFKWTSGPQKNSGYKVLTLIFSVKFLIDCIIIKYPNGSKMEPHVDKPSCNRPHYRINIVLWNSRKGGQFICERTIFTLFNRIYFFRADLYEHSVTTVDSGVRYVLSIGKTLKMK